MSELRRLVDDPETPESVREGLRDVAAGPETYDVEAGLRRLRGVLAAGAVGAAGTAAASTAGAAAKGWVVLALVGALAGGGAVAYVAGDGSPESQPDGSRRSAPAAALPLPSGSSDPSETGAPADPEANLHSSGSSAPTDPAAEGGRAELPDSNEADAPAEGAIDQSTGRPSGASGAETPEASSEPSAEPSTDSLREETLHLARVRSALESAPRRALRLARAGHRRFPAGVFEEERRALEVMALDRLGRRDEARRAAAAFVARYPNGQLTDRLRRITAER